MSDLTEQEYMQTLMQLVQLETVKPGGGVVLETWLTPAQVEHLEKEYLLRRFTSDDAIDAEVAKKNAQKKRIKDLKKKYPDVTPEGE